MMTRTKLHMKAAVSTFFLCLAVFVVGTQLSADDGHSRGSKAQPTDQKEETASRDDSPDDVHETSGSAVRTRPRYTKTEHAYLKELQREYSKLRDEIRTIEKKLKSLGAEVYPSNLVPAMWFYNNESEEEKLKRYQNNGYFSTVVPPTSNSASQANPSRRRSSSGYGEGGQSDVAKRLDRLEATIEQLLERDAERGRINGIQPRSKR